MYEALTKYIGQFEDVGTWIIDRENDGSKEHPIQMLFGSGETNLQVSGVRSHT